jgi:hypothetical protein
MIDWMGIPKGSTGSIFLPAADARAIQGRAKSLYGGQILTTSDAHTLVCEANNVTYIPIPSGASSYYAGLLTLEVPQGTRVKACKVIARQVTDAAPSERIRGVGIRRKILGSFQLGIEIEDARTLLSSEERLLAFFRWILSTLSVGDRWYQVILRYVGEISERVRQFGGNPGIIAPSPAGAIPGTPISHPSPGKGHTSQGQLEETGKIGGLIYDRFGDFEGFNLLTEHGARVTYHTRERHLAKLAGWAWRAQILVTVFTDNAEPRVPDRIVLHAPPGSPIPP